MKCKSCGASLDPTMSACGCGAPVELGRLTGILGLVCRACDAYNEPGARSCVACGKALSATEPEPPASPTPAPLAAAAPGSPPPSPPPGAPVVRSFSRPAAGSATRVIPSVLRPSAETPSTEQPALTPLPLSTTCPRCGADAAGRFCAQCGHALGARGTQVVARPPPAAPVEPAASLAPPRARLVVEAAGGPDGATFPLEAGASEAGRSRGAIAFPDDDCLAPHHATFFYRGGALHVRDEGAPGGVYLRLRGVSVLLRPGDHFALGDRLLRYAGPLPPAPPPLPDGTRRLGAPRPPPPAVVLEERLEGGACGRVFVRGGRSVTIGRAGCSVSLGDHPGLAPAHAELLVDAAGSVRLKDLGSPDGTYVRLPPHAERELHDADRVRLGRQVLRVAIA